MYLVTQRQSWTMLSRCLSLICLFHWCNHSDSCWQVTWTPVWTPVCSGTPLSPRFVWSSKEAILVLDQYSSAGAEIQDWGGLRFAQWHHSGVKPTDQIRWSRLWLVNWVKGDSDVTLPGHSAVLTHHHFALAHWSISNRQSRGRLWLDRNK